MATASVRLDKDLIDKATIMAKALNRTPSKQIEHWAKIGGIMEDNPALPYAFVRQSIIAEAEREAGKLESYVLHLDDMDQRVCIYCAEDLGLFEEG